MNRKEIVKRLGEHLGVTPEYLSVPSFNYQITTADEVYTIDQHGVITKSDGQVISMEEILNVSPPGAATAEEAMVNETPVESETEASIAEAESGIGDFECLEVKFPMEGHSALSLKNLINMFYSKQNLLMQAFKTEVPFMDDTFAEDLSNEKINTLENFKTAFEKLGADRCPGLAFDLAEETLTFKLDGINPELDIVNAFTKFSALINTLAKTLKRASFKQSQEENPKYALRTWLIRLGMNGEKYKATRKTMIAHLDGSSAFRTVREENE
ncbi:MAG: virulence-related protein [Clostridia bacterium]|nr:virulence-related protein [Clostridia bacterium]